MSSPYSRAPHSEGTTRTQRDAPNAALLIDFDNVTMGMRSDLSKELHNLLNSDIIKGKVTVQRAYADWRRYPQYIVPLSENSVDLIFAPAYGSSKKNATDIRMAIDAIELVFIRPEIGTFILLTGDSDFSSLVLKLKEYGKYVIGVGIQESSSDILVQNCDEYYSYTSIAGLRKTTDSDDKPVDPWILVEQAVDRMTARDDVMRSDRLKQVMMEIDPSFDEGNFGFSKFSRFLSEAGSRDLVTLKKLDNGQYQVMPAGSGVRDSGGAGKGNDRKSSGKKKASGKVQDDGSKGRSSGGTSGKDGGSGKKGPQEKGGRDRQDDRQASRGKGKGFSGRDEKDGTQSGEEEDPLQKGYRILRQAIESLSGGSGKDGAVRDSDLKRKMLQLDSSFDEGDLGFGKFSRFLRQAHDHEVVDLFKRDGGTYQVSLPRTASQQAEATQEKEAAREPEHASQSVGQQRGQEVSDQDRAQDRKKDRAEDGKEVRDDAGDEGRDEGSRRGALRIRRGGSRGRPSDDDGPPPLLEGQIVAPTDEDQKSASASTSEGTKTSQRASTSQPRARTPRGRRNLREVGSGAEQGSFPSLEVEAEAHTGAPAKGTGGPLDLHALGLPSDEDSLIRYLTNSYKGVGKKTAETVVEEFGPDLFQVLHENPGRLDSVIRADRAEQLLKGWRADLARRSQKRLTGEDGGTNQNDSSASESTRRTRRGSRTRARSKRGSSKEGRD